MIVSTYANSNVSFIMYVEQNMGLTSFDIVVFVLFFICDCRCCVFFTEFIVDEVARTTRVKMELS